MTGIIYTRNDGTIAVPLLNVENGTMDLYDTLDDAKSAHGANSGSILDSWDVVYVDFYEQQTVS